MRLYQQINTVMYYPYQHNMDSATFEMNTIYYTFYEQEYKDLHFMIGNLISGKELRRMWNNQWVK